MGVDFIGDPNKVGAEDEIEYLSDDEVFNIDPFDTSFENEQIILDIDDDDDPSYDPDIEFGDFYSDTDNESSWDDVDRVDSNDVDASTEEAQSESEEAKTVTEEKQHIKVDETTSSTTNAPDEEATTS